MTIGERIKQRRKEKHLSQVELATLTGLTQTTISALERSVNEPATASLGLIANALNCTVGELVGESETPADLYSPMEQLIIAAYRQQDMLGQQMVCRMLGVQHPSEAAGKKNA